MIDFFVVTSTEKKKNIIKIEDKNGQQKKCYTPTTMKCCCQCVKECIVSVWLVYFVLHLSQSNHMTRHSSNVDEDDCQSSRSAPDR